MIFDLSINTCIIPSFASMRTLAYYSHLIPVFIMVLLGLLVLVKSKKNLFSKVFLFFIITFSLWLIGDLITWTSSNYYLIYAVWSTLVFVEIVFYIFGLYFALIYSQKNEIRLWQKALLFVVTLFPFFITIIGKSVTGFDHQTCLAFNNLFLDNYKLYLEFIILLIILIYIIIPFFKKAPLSNIKSDIIVLGSMLLFLSVFGVTEYLGSITSDYRINLYSLFLLPIFLISIIYAVFELDIFKLKMLGTYYLVFGLVILTGGQLFFVESTTNKFLTILTIVITVGLSVILFRNLKRESNQRIQIEKLNIDLQDLIRQRESLTHLVTHKVKGSFTRTKYIFSEILEGSFGPLTLELKKMAEMGLESDEMGVRTVDLILNASNLQKGTVKFEMKPVDLKTIVLESLESKKDIVEEKGLEIEKDLIDESCMINADIFWMKEVVGNLIDNALNYTPKGKVAISLNKHENKILFKVKDSGVGITDEDKKNLFMEGGRGKESVKVNVNSTGYGLYSVKLIVEAHGGRVWAESEGKDKGATFFVEFDAM